MIRLRAVGGVAGLAVGGACNALGAVVAFSALGAVVALPVRAAVEGQLFEDRNANGVQEPGEPGLVGLEIALFGTAGDGSPYRTTTTSGAAGGWSLGAGDGCYLVDLPDPVGWRLGPGSAERIDPTTPAYVFPVGLPRFSKLDHGAASLATGPYAYASMGDSIAWNFNVCGYPESFWYANQVGSRLDCAAPGAGVTVIRAAVKGEHSDDLLVDDNDDPNNVFRMLELQPQLITISMIGNDLLNVDVGGTPTTEETNRAIAEVLDARQNLQEAIAALLSGIPDGDIALNTLYDNLAYDCPGTGTTDFHRAWLPIIDRMLRELAWGQVRRVSTVEAAAEFGQEGQLGGCSGFSGLVCRDFFGFDRIHPDNDGFTVMREKVWEAAGGINLGAADALGRTALDGVDYGYLRRVRRLLPRDFATVGGARAERPAAALDDTDGDTAASITLGVGDEAFVLSGFPDWFDEIVIVKVVAGVRYGTAGVVVDDFYRIEASTTGTFRPPPGHVYTPTDWNFFTPLVGGGGPNQPVENPDYPDARVLAMPEVVGSRTVTATLTRNPLLEPGADDYSWPALTHDDLAQSAVRVAAAPVAGTAGNDAFTVELDAGWLDVYGWEKPRPDDVRNLTVARDATMLTLGFDPLAGAERYNVYAGTLQTLASGYDHGADARCDVSTEPAGRRLITTLPDPSPGASAYLLVSAHVDDVESPTGSDGNGREIDRSQSTCP